MTLSFFAHFAVKTQSPSITIMLSWLRRESSGPGGRRGQSTGCCGGYIDHRVDSMARRQFCPPRSYRSCRFLRALLLPQDILSVLVTYVLLFLDERKITTEEKK